MSMTIANARKKVLARKFLQFVSLGDVKSISGIISDDWIMHGALPNMPRGKEGIRRLFKSFGHIEQVWRIKDMIAEDDKVVVRAVNTCMQESFHGVPAADRTQIFSAMFIHKITNGKIVETWRNADDLGRLLQLGATISRPVADEAIF